MSILKKWYSGNLFPDEEIVPGDIAYRSVQRKIGEEKEFFKEKLSPKDRERFEDLEDLILRSCSMECYENFSYGFKLGANLMYEITTEDKESEV